MADVIGARVRSIITLSPDLEHKTRRAQLKSNVARLGLPVLVRWHSHGASRP